MRRSVLGCVFLLLLIHGALRAEEKAWRGPLEFESQEVKVKLLNWELTSDGKWLLVHLTLRSTAKESVYFSWQRLLTLETAEAVHLSPNYDALVDRNGAGLTRTVGDFELKPGEKASISIPFVLGKGDLPGRLLLEDGRPSELIKPRR